MTYKFARRFLKITKDYKDGRRLKDQVLYFHFYNLKFQEDYDYKILLFIALNVVALIM